MLDKTKLLKQYVAKRNKRTGQAWRVVRRYKSQDGYVLNDRALLENEEGKRVRIVFDVKWRRAR